MHEEEEQELVGKYGKFNVKGFRDLEKKYDIYQIEAAIEEVRETMGGLEKLVDDMEKLKTGASEMIEGHCSFAYKKYSLEDCGDLSDLVMEVCESLSEYAENLETAHDKLSPLHRLLPTDDDEIYINSGDTLDQEEGEEEEEEDW